MRKRMGGIGGSYYDSKDQDMRDEEGPAPDVRKLEASKLLIKAFKSDNPDPKLVASAVTTLVKCASDESESDEEGAGDLGEMD
jgi:hypothetical protein